MNVIRKIYEAIPSTIQIPSSLKNRKVEVILLPLDDEQPSVKTTKTKSKAIDNIIGAWKGEPLTRPDQGEYENRESFK